MWNIGVRYIFKLHTEYMLLFLAHYCNNLISVNSYILEVPSFFIICILVIVLCRHVSSFVQRQKHIRTKYRIIFPIHKHVLKLYQVFVSLCQLRPKKSVLASCFPSCLPNFSFIEGFNIAENIGMIVYVSTNLKIMFIYFLM